MANQKYEMMVIVRPDLTQKQTEAELEALRGFIKAQKGEIYHEDLWGMRALAYPIKKHTSGYYAIFYFEIDGNELKEISKNIRLESNTLRHLVVKLPANYEIKSLADFDLEDFDVSPKEEKPEARPAKRAPKKVAKKKEEVEKKEEKKEAPKAEAKKEATPKKEAAKEDKKESGKEKLEKIDEKLQSIIDDPDIMDI